MTFKQFLAYVLAIALCAILINLFALLLWIVTSWIAWFIDPSVTSLLICYGICLLISIYGFLFQDNDMIDWVDSEGGQASPK